MNYKLEARKEKNKQTNFEVTYWEQLMNYLREQISSCLFIYTYV